MHGQTDVGWFIILAICFSDGHTRACDASRNSQTRDIHLI